MPEETRPDDCPKRPQQCPMDSPAFIARMAQIEAALASHRETRHNINAAVTQAINEIRLEQGELEDKLKDMSTSIASLVESNRQLVEALRGGLVGGGLIEASVKYEKRIRDLEDWKRDIRSFIAGVVCIAGLAGGLIGFLADKLIHNVVK